MLVMSGCGVRHARMVAFIQYRINRGSALRIFLFADHARLEFHHAMIRKLDARERLSRGEQNRTSFVVSKTGQLFLKMEGFTPTASL